MAKEIKSYVAYLADGTPVSFRHGVDYQQALRAGLLANPPGTPEPEKVPESEGETVKGIAPLQSAAPEKETPEDAPETGKRAKKIPR